MASINSIGVSVQLGVVDLLKQVLQWTPVYRPGLNSGLIQAAKIGSAGCVRVLLSAGADVDAEDEHGDTAFVHAFQNRHQDVMEILHAAGACTEIVRMSVALTTGDIEFIKFCAKLEIPVENEDWNTSLDEVEILLNHLNLDPFCSTYGIQNYINSPFLYLAQEGSDKVLSLILNSSKEKHGYTQECVQTIINSALATAIKHKRMNNVILLIENFGADPSVTDSLGRNAFLQACETDESLAIYCLEKGWCNVASTDNEGLSGLHWASCVGFHNLCLKLIASKCDVNVHAKLGATPLMIACSGRHLNIVRTLLKHGADVNKQTPEGWTALHVSVWAAAPRVMKVLLSAGADPNCQATTLSHNGDIVPGSTPLHISISLDSSRMMQHLMDYNVDVSQSALVWAGDQKKVQHLTPLQHCILAQAWDLIGLLANAGSPAAELQPWLLHLEKSRAAQLTKLLQDLRPPSLVTITVVFIRKMLAAHAKAEATTFCIADEVKKLTITTSVKQLLLFENYLSQKEITGSFEI